MDVRNFYEDLKHPFFYKVKLSAILGFYYFNIYYYIILLKIIYYLSINQEEIYNEVIYDLLNKRFV